MKPLTQALLTVATAGLAILSALVAAAPTDFDADGRSDILWRNAATGENYLYFMSGLSIVNEGYLRTVADLGWGIAGIGDFDGDGKADILWRNSVTGENYIYLMNGTETAGEGYIRTVADQNWEVAGVGDLDGDGKADIVWRNSSTGENYVYPMDGFAIKPTEGYLRTLADLGWGIAGIGDFDGDGKADILWRNSVTGENYIYLMSGTSIVGEGHLGTVAVNWQIVGVADFDGNRKADVLWRNSVTGENYVYFMDGTSIVDEGYLRTVPDLSWEVVAVGDYDGDGRADILWRNATTGENYIYPMDGRTIKPTEGDIRKVADLNWRTPAANTVTLAWDAVVAANLSGYRVYYGTAPGTYLQAMSVGNVTTYTVSGLSSGQYYFAVTAVDSSGNESPYSNVVFKNPQ